MNTAGPLLDARDEGAIAEEFLSAARGFAPGWEPQDGEPGFALARIYARYLHALGERLNQAPAKNRLAFFETLGISLVPAKAAVAPVVFEPINGIGDTRIPAGSQVGASVPGRDEPLVFETRNSIALVSARLAEVVSLWPGRDAWADHSSAAMGAGPFTAFEGLKPTPHEFYLAHKTHFHLAGHARVEVQFELARPGNEPLAWEWEYWDGQVWRGFKAFAEPGPALATSADGGNSIDGTVGLTRSGSVRLVADCAETKPRRVQGVESYWLRARLLEPLPPEPGRELPLVDRITIRTVVENGGLDLDLAYADGLKLDPGKTFYPFGQQPGPGTSFYFSNAEAFSRPGAVVTLRSKDAETPQSKSADGTTAGARPELATEYWDGFRWADLPGADEGDGTFSLPLNLEPVAVNNETACWLRMRVVSGGFFRTRTIKWTDGGTTNTVVVLETVPPALAELKIDYVYTSPPEAPEACFAFSDFQWVERTREARWRGDAFEPFSFVEDRLPALYFGFDRPLPVDLVSMYLDIAEEPGRLRGPLLQWEYFDGSAWLAVPAADETANLVRPGMVAVPWPGAAPLPSGEAVLAEGTTVQLANAAQAARFHEGDRVYLGEAEKGELGRVATVGRDTLTLATPLSRTHQRAAISVAMLPRFGTPRAWLRARLQSDGEPVASRVNAISLNAAWADQVRTFQQEVIGSSTGEANQAMFIRQVPVLPGEVIEVRELDGPRAAVELAILEEELARAGLPATALRTVADPRTGAIIEAWVRWEHRPNLAFSGPGDRHYTIERTRGRVIFGDGVHGRVPPIGGGNVRVARYASGGGATGNVGAARITQLLSGAPAAGVSNPRAAEGGADGEGLERVHVRAPQALRHRSQALSLTDYEDLARQASPAVAMARALPATHPSGRPAPGWVKVIIQPYSEDQQPQPSFGLRRQVQQYLEARVPASLGAQLSVTGPDYLPVGVEARLAPADIFRAGEVHDGAVRRLLAFLHPVTGGPEGEGWPFGRAVYLSDVAAVLEAVEGVDYVATLTLLVDGAPMGASVPVPPDRIVVAGSLRVTLAGEEV